MFQITFTAKAGQPVKLEPETIPATPTVSNTQRNNSRVLVKTLKLQLKVFVIIYWSCFVESFSDVFAFVCILYWVFYNDEFKSNHCACVYLFSLLFLLCLVDCIKLWLNGLASRRKLKSWLCLRLRLARRCMHFPWWLALTLIEIKFFTVQPPNLSLFSPYRTVP